MDDTLLVCRLEPLGDLEKERQRLLDRNRTALDPIRQRLTLDQLHDEKARVTVPLEAIQSRYVVVVQRGKNLGLTLETSQPLRVSRHFFQEELDRHLATELRVLGAIDLSHAACTEGGEDLVVAEPRACF